MSQPSKTTSLSLRPYQSDGINEIKNYFSRGEKKVLLQLPTGAGKTLCFSYILKGVFEKGKNAILVVRGRALVDQASQRLFREGVDHGVVMAGHWNYRPTAPIQVCSIDTLYRRRLHKLPADLIVIDEAHMATSSAFKWLIGFYPEAFFLSVTATPFVKSGLRHIADHVVYPISFGQLIDQGYLVKPKYFSFPIDINFEEIEIDKKTGDYNQTQLGEAVNRSKMLSGDIISHWRRHSLNRPTICFAVNVKHSKTIANNFKDAGIQAEHIDADTPEEERKWVLSQLETGKIKVVSNVGILGTGVDLPFIETIILARPTKSKNLYIQQVGRGSRLSPGKERFIVLDHASNVMEHGAVEDEEKADLDGFGKAKKESKKDKMILCPKCFCTFLLKEYTDYICPGQFYDSQNNIVDCLNDCRPVKKEFEPVKMIVDSKKELVEITDTKQFFRSQFSSDLDKLITIAKVKKYKWQWVWFKLKDRYGKGKADGVAKEIRDRINGVEKVTAEEARAYFKAR